MNNVQLYIENSEVELNQSVSFAITKQFEDINDPTSIINSWSKTVSIPFTIRNDNLFGHIYSPDRLVVQYDKGSFLENPEDYQVWNTETQQYVPAQMSSENVFRSKVPLRRVQSQIENTESVEIIDDEFILSQDNRIITFDYDADRTYKLIVNLQDDGETGADGDVVEYATWKLNNVGLESGKTYAAKLSYQKSGSDNELGVSVYETGNINGMYFDPTLKLNFRLIYNGSLLMSGYAKMDSITRKNGTGTYNLTLNGELGRLFQEMKKINFDVTSEDGDYYIDGGKYVDSYINKELVKRTFETANQSQYDVYGAPITDIIGFVPNNSFDPEFDYNTFQVSETESKQLTEVLEENPDWYTLGISADSVLPDGMSPRGIGEYRSYLQQPFIYWNKLWQIVQNKCEEVTGYKFDLDDSWFNTSNPYWYNLVYMLKKFSNKGSDFQATNTYKGSFFFNQWGASIAYNTPIYGDWFVEEEGSTEEIPLIKEWGGGSSKFDISNGTMYFDCRGEYDMRFRTAAVYSGNVRKTVRLSPVNALKVYMATFDSEGRLVDTQKDTQFGIICNENYISSYANLGAKWIVGVGDSQTAGAYYDVIPFTIPVEYDKLAVSGREYVRIAIGAEWLNNNKPIVPTDATYVYPTSITIDNLVPSVSTVNVDILNYEGKRSYARFKLNDLWNNEYKPFDELIRYCKMFRILVLVDDINKKIRFVPANVFFSEKSIECWDDKLDISKDFTITPITFDNKYLLFGYTDNKTLIGEKYREKYGFDYGEKNVVTSYNFNTETTNLFNNGNTSITNTDTVLSWNNIYRLNLSYSFPAELYVTMADKDGKYVDCFGSFYFKNGLKSFDTDEVLKMRNVLITDDSNMQLKYNTFYYSQDNNGVRVLTYPHLDIVYNDFCCTFAVPMENYTYLNNYAGKSDIYTLFWKNYLQERYSIQNKKVDCYLKLSPVDFINFQFNKFIRIENQLYMVNKIYDYDITSNESTKVELITVQNLSGYTTNNY